MSVVISSGHGKYVRGASGYLDEVDEARKVVNRVYEILVAAGVGVKKFHDDTSTTQSQNLNTIVAYHNSQVRDLDVSVHFNAYQTTSKPMGCEVLYVTQYDLADEVSAAVADAGDFVDRGPKKRTDLAFLNGTHEPAILIETCFVDSSVDAELYRGNFETICQAIAEGISGVSLVVPPEPPLEAAEPTTGIVGGLIGGDLLNIRAAADADAAIIGTAQNDDHLAIVGSAMNQSTKWYKCVFGQQDGIGVSVFGWASSAYVDVSGEAPEEGFWHEDITATVFGMEGDEQDSAYGGWIDENTIGVSFPYKWRDAPRPTRVELENPANGKRYVCGVVDVGPWNTNDPAYVLDVSRPLAEMQYEDKVKAQNGQIPTNDAGIDLTEPVAKALGILGKGKVRWRFG